MVVLVLLVGGPWVAGVQERGFIADNVMSIVFGLLALHIVLIAAALLVWLLCVLGPISINIYIYIYM